MRLWGNAALGVASLALALLMGEAAARALGLAPEVRPIELSDDASVFQRSENPILGFELKADYRNPDPDDFVSYARTNGHGQRDVERSLAKPVGVLRVLMLGDSVVEGSGLRDLDDTLSRRLEALYPDGSVEVLNFGVSGYCTRAEVELLETKGLAFSPDVVLVVFVENDFQNYNRHLVRLGGDEPPRPAWVKALFLGSALFRVVALRLDLYGFAREQNPLHANREAIGDDNVAEGLERLAELARREGFRPVVAIWPRFSDERIEDAHGLPGGVRELVIEHLARMHGISAYRLSPFFRSDWRENAPGESPRIRYTQGDRMHPRAEGTRVGALALRQVLERARTEPPPEPRRGPGDELALQAARSLGRAEPDYAPAWLNTGLKLEQAGDAEAAEEHYRTALRLREDYPEAHNNLANLLIRRGEIDAAVEHLERAVAADRFYTAARYNLGRALTARGEVAAAREAYLETLRLDPQHPQAREALSRLGEG